MQVWLFSTTIVMQLAAALAGLLGLNIVATACVVLSLTVTVIIFVLRTREMTKLKATVVQSKTNTDLIAWSTCT
jgi:hypothetical protein